MPAQETVESPLVSIVIPCYNHAQFVQESIQSVIDQDYENIELIIIDDGSKDNSVEVIQKMIPACEERFVRFEFRYRPNKGLCATLNEALEWCEGEYFSPLASDDIALSHKTSFLVNKITENCCAVVFGLSQQFGDPDKRYFKEIKGCTHNFNDLMLQINIPDAPAAMLRKSSVLKVGGYAEDVKLEDRYMWLSLTASNEKLITFPEIVVLYRDHKSNTIKNVRKMHESRLEVLKKFSNSSVYDKSIKKAYITCSKELADTESIVPIMMVLKSKNLNGRGLLVVLKALTPKYILALKKSIFN